MRLRISAVVLLLLPVPLIAQTVSTPTVTAVKDPSATAVLTQMTAATGWTLLSVPADAVITGSITRHFTEGDASGGLSIKLRGATQFRFEESETQARVVVNGAAGALVTGLGTARRLPVSSAVSMRGLILPIMSSVPNWADPTVDVTSLGKKLINGETCNGVRIVGRAAATDPLASLQNSIAPVILWISAASGLPLRAEFLRAAADNHYALIPATLQFSDYRTVNGVAVAFRQDELIQDKPTTTLQFTSVQFNAGLTDSDFPVATILAGAQ